VLKAMMMTKLRWLGALAVVAVLGAALAGRQAAADPPGGGMRPSVADDPAKANREGVRPDADAPREGGRIVITARGDRVSVLTTSKGEEYQLEAGRVEYDEGTKRLRAEGGANPVRLLRRRGKDVETVECDRLLLDLKAGTMEAEGAGSIRAHRE
jgi:hypothetical protein